MATHKELINVTCPGGRPWFHQATSAVTEIVERSGIRDGICVVYTHHTTCSIMIQEASFDETYTGLEYLQQDLWDVLEKVVPTTRVEGQYMHPGPKLTQFSIEHGETKPETLNTDAHLRSAVMGRSETIIVSDGKLDLGNFAHVYFIDFDQTRTRDREIAVQVIGE